jgi:hypothetical protein
MLSHNTNKERSYDRILVLKQIEGQKVKGSTGLTDPRLFTGENKLHAIRNHQTCLWYFKYEMGLLPEPLKTQFTSFGKLLQHAKTYFSKRGLEIVEVID